MEKYFYLFLCICFSISDTLAQSITNVRAETSGDIVNVYYDLLGTIEGQIYQVSLFSSHNDMANPVSYVSGEVGSHVKAGTGKKIEWQARKELLRFTGEITFEVEASLIFSPIAFKNPQPAQYKRGKTYPLSWEGGKASENLRLELYQGNAKMNDIVRTQNNGHYQWSVPSGTKPGSNYTIKISSVDKPDNFKVSPPFVIKRKIATGIKLLPVAILAGAAIYIITSGGDDPGPNSPPAASQLPGPPEGQ